MGANHPSSKRSIEVEAEARATRSLIIVQEPEVEPLRPDELDLCWFFSTEDEDPLTSGYAALVRRLLLRRRNKGRGVEAPFAERELDARDRRRRIASILAAAGPEAAGVLRTALGGGLLFPDAFGHLGNVACGSKAATSAHRRSKSRRPLADWLADRVLEAAWDDAARALVRRLRDDARRQYRGALAAYREGKRLTGLSGREANGGGHG